MRYRKNMDRPMLIGRAKKNSNTIIWSMISALLPVLIILISSVLLHGEIPFENRAEKVVWFLLTGFSGLSMFLCLELKKIRGLCIHPGITCLFSMTYALSAFSLLQTAEIGLHIAFACFPLLFLGYEMFSHKESYKFLYLLFGSVVIIAKPVVGIFALAVLIILEISGVREKSDKSVSEKGYNDRMANLIIYTIFVLCLTAVVWIPYVVNSWSASGIGLLEGYDIFVDWGTLISRFYLLADESIYVYEHHGCNLFCTFLVLFLFFLGNLSSEKTARERGKAILLFCVLTAAINISPVYEIITCFSETHSDMVSLGFLPVFFLVLVASEIEKESVISISYAKLILFYIFVWGIFGLTTLYAKGYHNSTSVFAMMIVMTLYMMLVIFYRKRSIGEKTFLVIVCLGLIVELGISTAQIIRDFGAFKEDMTTYYTKSRSTTQEKTEDPFEDSFYSSPSDLSVHTAAHGVTIIPYDSGIVAVDSHKVADELPFFTISYRFTAEKSGYLYVKLADEVSDLGWYEKGDAATWKKIHISNAESVEYEYLQACYLSAKEVEELKNNLKQEEVAEEHLNSIKQFRMRVIGIIFLILGCLIFVLAEYRYKLVKDELLRKLEQRYKRPIPVEVKAFMISLLILIIALFFAGIAPFGSNSLWHGDGSSLTIPTMYQARDHLMKGELFYSFSVGGGQNLYYFNPALFLFYWLCLIPEGWIESVLAVVVVIKIALGAASFVFYLKNMIWGTRYDKSQLDERLMIAISAAYALSMYQLVLVNYFYWADLVFLLPLVLWAEERMLTYYKAGWYVLLLALCMILNCYNSVYICIFLALWFFACPFQNFFDVLKRGVYFAFHSLLAAGMSFWVLWATVLSRKYGYYAATDSVFPKNEWHQNFLTTFRQFFIGADPIAGTSDAGMANLYCGLFCGILILIGLMSRKKIWAKWYRLMLILFLIISTNNSILNYIWNGFHYQSNLPGRYTFLLIFLLLTVACDYVYLMSEKDIKLMLPAVAIVGGVLACIQYFVGCSKVSCEYSLIFLCIYGLFSLWYVCRSRSVNIKSETLIFAFCLIAMVELAVNTCYTFHLRSEDYSGLSWKDASEWIHEYDTDIHGLERIAFLGEDSENQGAECDLGCLNLFNSFLTPQQYRYALSVGLLATNNSITDYSNLTPFSNAVCRIKYMIVNRYGEGTGVDFDGYDVIGEQNGMLILKNDHMIPAAFTIPADAIDELYKADKKETVANALVNAFAKGKSIFAENTILEKTEEKRANTYDTGKVLGENYTETTLRIQVPRSGRYYLGGYGYSSLGECIGEQLMELDRILYQPDYLYIFRFDDEAFQSFLDGIGKAGASNINIRDGRITCDVDTKNGEALCINALFEPGWKCFVDGEGTTIEEMECGLMLLRMKDGKHHVELTFRPVGLISGIVITILSWILFLGISYISRSFSKRRLLMEGADN